MKVIETKAPIDIDNIKKFFVDKSIFYLIDYKKSDLKGGKLLTYLSNLDLPCDIKNIDDELILEYFNSISLVNIKSLENVAMQILFEYKGLIKDKIYSSFINANKQVVEKWIEKLESLRLYNMYIVNNNEFTNYVKSFPRDENKELNGINFISLLKREEFFLFYSKKAEDKKLKYFVNYFDDYMFKGKNLFEYWANEKNPLFLLTWATANGKGKEYIQAREKDKDIIKDVSPI